jgi:hypothetical protein
LIVGQSMRIIIIRWPVTRISLCHNSVLSIINVIPANRHLNRSF